MMYQEDFSTRNVFIDQLLGNAEVELAAYGALKVTENFELDWRGLCPHGFCRGDVWVHGPGLGRR